MPEEAVRKDTHFAQGVVYLPDILWLGVEGGIIHTCVIDTILLAASDAYNKAGADFRETRRGMS